MLLNCYEWYPKKEVIALAQTYFAIQTRLQELSEKEYSSLTEDEKRFYQRNLTKKGNRSLNITARNAGVRNFDRFHNYGYRGLYNGETANDIAKRKGLRYRENILDNMCSDELIANLFRISQTEQKLKMIMYKVRIIVILLIMKLVRILEMLLRKTVVRCLRRWKDLIKV